MTKGAAGDHVSRIQIALLALDGASIDQAELNARRYPARCYPIKRSVRLSTSATKNRQTALVGKMTIAALDKEMVEFERLMNSAPVCHCRDFPRAQNAVGSRRPTFLLAFAASPGIVGAILTGTPREQALGRLGLAKLLVVKARDFIRLGTAQILSGLPIGDFKNTEPRKALVTHFKINQIRNPVDHLNRLDRVYQLIASTFASASTIFIDDPTTGDFANAHLGGFFHKADPVLGKIRFGPAYGGKGELFQTSVLVHEGAHFVDSGIDHFASELPAPNGTPVDSSPESPTRKITPSLTFEKRRATRMLRPGGKALDLGTGCGALRAPTGKPQSRCRLGRESGRTRLSWNLRD